MKRHPKPIEIKVGTRVIVLGTPKGSYKLKEGDLIDVLALNQVYRSATVLVRPNPLHEPPHHAAEDTITYSMLERISKQL